MSSEFGANRNLRTHNGRYVNLREPLGEAREAGAIRDDLDLDYEADRIGILVSGIGLQSPQRGQEAFAKKAASYIEDHLAGLTQREG